MATITREGAPGKDTVGQVGDICIDSTTLRKFECVAVYTTTTNNETTVEYEWDEIHSNDTGDGSGGNTEDNSAVITELLVKTGSLENQVEEIDSTLVDVQEDILELKEASDIIATDSTIIEDTHAGVFKINEIGGVHKQFTTTGAQLWNGKYVTNALNKEQDDFVADTTMAGNIRMPITAGKQYSLSVNGVLTIMRYSFKDADGNTITALANAKTTVVAPEGSASMTWRVNSYHAETDIIMLNEGDVALPYEPYTGGQASPNPNYPQEIKKTVVAGVKTHGKNFLKNTNEKESADGGLTFNVNDDGAVTINGTATKDTAYNLITNSIPISDKMYTNVISLDGSYNGSIKHRAFDEKFSNNVTGELGEAKLLKSGIKYSIFRFTIYTGTVCNNLKLGFMVATEGYDTYEPYQESTIEFSKPITLYGAPNVAVQDLIKAKQINRWYVDEVFDGSENWQKYNDTNNLYYVNITTPGDGTKRCMCSHFKYANSNLLNNLDECRLKRGDAVDVFYVSTSQHNSVESFKSFLADNPMTVVYRPTTPIVEPLPEVDQAALTQLKTFEGVTYVEFISDIQPTFKAESSTTQEGSYVLDLLARTNAVEKQVEVLDDTLLYAQEDILDLEEAFHIPEVTDTVLDGSYPGLLKVNEIGGKMEQFSTTGAQLFDKDNLTTGNILDDGSFGTSTSWGYQLISVAPNESYTISGSVGNSGGYFAYYDESKNVVSVIGSSDNMTVTVPDNVTCLGVSVILSTDADTLMVNAGTEPLPYEPYTGGIASPNPEYPQEINKTVVTGVKTHGKNFLDCRGLVETEKNGITFTPVYENEMLQYIEANGTATARADFTISKQIYATDRSIIFSGISGGSGATYSMFLAMVGNEVTYNSIYNAEKEVTFADDVIYYVVKIRVVEGQTVSKLKFYPMIRNADIADYTYEPYTESSYTFSEPIDLYGTDDVQDVITAKPIKRRFAKRVFDGSENWILATGSSYVSNTFYTGLHDAKKSEYAYNGLCDSYMFTNKNHHGVLGDYECTLYHSYSYPDQNWFYLRDTSCTTAQELKEKLSANPIALVYELAEETTEQLPLVDQIGLNNLLTYSDVTHVEFDCDGPQPTLKAEYPTSKENSYILESLLNTRTNALNQELINNKIAALEASIVSNI